MVISGLPAENREFSPRTGYTREHWEAAADGLLRAAWRWATPDGALLDLPGPPSASGVRSDGLEGYARTFLAAAFRVAGGGGKDPHGWLDRYAQGLAAGTRTPGRDDAESWPLIRDLHVHGQPMVESASVALGLRLTRPWLWDRLDSAVQDRTEEWLRGALRHAPAPNNWYLFPFTVAGFLESVGRGDAETARARRRGLGLLEQWYAGQGWYADGDGRAFDHYNGWALHLYPVLDTHLAGGDGAPAGPAQQHGARLRAHLDSHCLLFGADGAPLYFGRSLTYRFAAAAAVGLGAVTGHTPLTPGTSRRLLSGSLRYFLERGAVDDAGLLRPGWHGAHAATLQPYSGPATPTPPAPGPRRTATPRTIISPWSWPGCAAPGAASTRSGPGTATAGGGRPPGTGRSSRAGPACRACASTASPWSGAATNCASTGSGGLRRGLVRSRPAGPPASGTRSGPRSTRYTGGRTRTRPEPRRARPSPRGPSYRG